MKNPTLGQWLDKFEHLRAGEVSTRTEQNYTTSIGYLRDFFGEDKPLHSITSAHGDDFRVHLRKLGLAPPTVTSHMVRAIAVFDRAVIRGLIRKNPFMGLAPAAEKPVKTWKQLSAEQVAALIRAAPTPDWKRFLGLCAYAGLRRGEALRLLNGDVEQDKRRIHVVPDTAYETTKQRARDVLLVPELHALLEVDPDPDTLVCPISGDLHRKMVGFISRGVFYQGIIQRAGMEIFEAPFHTLRRWRAQSWREVYPESTVDLMLGHSVAVARDNYVTVPESVFSAKGSP